MTVKLSCCDNERIEPPFMVFMNPFRSSSIRGVPNNAPGVSYHSGPKGCIITVVML